MSDSGSNSNSSSFQPSLNQVESFLHQLLLALPSCRLSDCDDTSRNIASSLSNTSAGGTKDDGDSSPEKEKTARSVTRTLELVADTARQIVDAYHQHNRNNHNRSETGTTPPPESMEQAAVNNITSPTDVISQQLSAFIAKTEVLLKNAQNSSCHTGDKNGVVHAEMVALLTGLINILQNYVSNCKITHQIGIPSLPGTAEQQRTAAEESSSIKKTVSPDGGVSSARQLSRPEQNILNVKERDNEYNSSSNQATEESTASVASLVSSPSPASTELEEKVSFTSPSSISSTSSILKSSSNSHDKVGTASSQSIDSTGACSGLRRRISISAASKNDRVNTSAPKSRGVTFDPKDVARDIEQERGEEKQTMALQEQHNEENGVDKKTEQNQEGDMVQPHVMSAEEALFAAKMQKRFGINFASSMRMSQMAEEPQQKSVADTSNLQVSSVAGDSAMEQKSTFPSDGSLAGAPAGLDISNMKGLSRMKVTKKMQQYLMGSE